MKRLICSQLFKEVERKGWTKVIPKYTKAEVMEILQKEFHLNYHDSFRVANDPQALKSWLEVEIVEENKPCPSLAMPN